MAERGGAALLIEEYYERRIETAAGHRVDRYYRRARLDPDTGALHGMRQLVDTAAPIARAVAIALAPVAGRLALRLIASRVRAVLLPRARPRIRALPTTTAPLALSGVSAGPRRIQD